ncbi:kinase-like domain-containing protein [Syncephalis fuscata]|nr:kinase-like domain-containing protein [Syncephalis fuscata]
MENDREATQRYSASSSAGLATQLSDNSGAVTSNPTQLVHRSSEAAVDPYMDDELEDSSKVMASIIFRFPDRPDVEKNVTLWDLKHNFHVSCNPGANVCIKSTDPIISKIHFKLSLSDRASGSGICNIVMFTNLSQSNVYVNTNDAVSYKSERVVLDETKVNFRPPNQKRGFSSRFQCIIMPQKDMDKYFGKIIPPQLKEEFNFISEAGSGSFATVIKAQEKKTKREVNVWKGLNHQNIVKFHRFIDFPDTSVYLLEYMRGGTLEDFYKKGSSISLTTRLSYFQQICNGLAYLHGLKVIHRDLKPQNILLTDTEPVIVKIADLGVAKNIGHFENAHTTCGTKLYAAPEIFHDVFRDENGHYTSSVDIWSLGLLLIELIKMSPVDLSLTDLLRLKHLDPKNLKVPDSVRPVVIGTLKVEPEQRMTITEVLEHKLLNNVATDRKRKADEYIQTPGPEVDLSDRIKRTCSLRGTNYWGQLRLIDGILKEIKVFPLRKSAVYISDQSPFDIPLCPNHFSDVHCRLINTSCFINDRFIGPNSLKPIKIGDTIKLISNKGEKNGPVCLRLEEYTPTSATSSFTDTYIPNSNATFRVPESSTASNANRTVNVNTNYANDALQPSTSQLPWGCLRSITDPKVVWHLSKPKLTIRVNQKDKRCQIDPSMAESDEKLFEIERQGDNFFVTRLSHYQYRMYEIKLAVDVLEMNVKTPIEFGNNITCTEGTTKTSSGTDIANFLFAYLFVKC